jgi:hypothetical protein
MVKVVVVPVAGVVPVVPGGVVLSVAVTVAVTLVTPGTIPPVTETMPVPWSMVT